ncbi:MAG: ankyrin repeat domain-containing protein [Legionella sp.]|nr:ankyrin repeat domain-containing protein [Legionella sp.]
MWLLDKIKKSGYDQNRLYSGPGRCFGIAVMGMRAFLLHDMDTFYQRLQFIKEKDERYFQQLQKESSEIEQNAAEDDAFSRFDIRAFFEGIELIHRAEEYKAFFPEKADLSQDAVAAKDLILPGKLEDSDVDITPTCLKQFGLTHVSNQEDIENYLVALTDVLIQQKERVSILLGSCDAPYQHGIALNFDPEKNKDECWSTVDQNYLSTEYAADLSCAACAARAAKGFYFKDKPPYDPDKYIPLDSEIYVLGEPSDELISHLTDFYASEAWKKLHVVTTPKLEVKFNSYYNWLFHAIEKNRIKTVKLIINQNPDSAYILCDRRNTLDFSIRHGQVEIVKRLLDLEVSCNKPIAPDKNLLASAAYYGNIEIIKLLLDYGYRNFQDALHSAAEEGYLEVLQTLLESAPDVNQTDKSGNTALHSAAKGGHIEVAQELLQYVSDADQKNTSGQKPFQLACKYNHFKLMVKLIQYGVAKQKESIGKSAYLGNVLKDINESRYESLYKEILPFFDAHTLDAIFRDTSSLVLVLNRLNKNQCDGILAVDVFKVHLKETVKDVRNLAALFCELKEENTQCLLNSLSPDLNNMFPDNKSQAILVSTLDRQSKALSDRAKEIFSASDSKSQSMRSKIGQYFFRKNKQNKGAAEDEGCDKTKGLD